MGIKEVLILVGAVIGLLWLWLFVYLVFSL